MAYLDRTADPRRRTTAITGVIAIHALIAYGLVTGLVGTFTPHGEPALVGTNFPLTPPPPPSPEPEQTRKPISQPDKPTVPDLAIDLTKQADRVEVTPETDRVDVTPTPSATYTPYDPPKTPGFKPKPATPRSAPARWVTTDDYPSRDLREGNEGVTGFRAVVGTNGRIGACEIVRSSGHPGLDAATCRAVIARARFEPATDETGAKVVGTYGNSVRWQIPR